MPATGGESKIVVREAIEAWEDEGGAPAAPAPVALTGTENQVEWAERIRLNLDKEFDRIAALFQTIADQSRGGKAAATREILAILADKRREVMSHTEAGYFIHEWQEVGDRVRRLILGDERYREVRTRVGADADRPPTLSDL